MTKPTQMPTLYYPIPNTVSSKDFELISKEFNIIPYFGLSEFQSHGILQTLFDLSQYSPTKAAVTNGIVDYAFGGNIKFVGRTFEGIDTTDVINNTVQISEITQIVEELTKAIETTPLLDNTRRNKVKGFFHNRLNVGGVETTEFNYTVERIFNNPEHLAQLADLLTDYDPKKGISTKRIEQKGATKETNNFKTLLTEKLNSKPKASHTGATSNEPPNFLEKFTEL